MKVVNISGYMGSGRSAMTDLFREFDGYYVPSSHDEFELLTHYDGLNHLYHLMETGSSVAFSEALERFKILTGYLGLKPSGIQKLCKAGANYDERYSDFSKNTEWFIHSIVKESWYSNHPHGNIFSNACELFVTKLKGKITNKAPWPKRIFHVMNKDGYEDKFIDYLEKILEVEGYCKRVINNGFEVNNCSLSMKLFRNVYSVNITRDIRDIYLTMTSSNDHFYSDHYRTISGVFDVKCFAEYQNLLHQEIPNDILGNKVLNVRFEDMVKNSDKVANEVLSFIDEVPSLHKRKGEFFSPQQSAVNTKLWTRKLSKSQLEGVKYLEKNLPHLCYL